MGRGVAGDAFFQRLHFAQHLLALFPAVRDLAFGGHLHAEGVHLAQEFQGFLRHPVFQSMLADEHGGFHQGAGRVTQQHPVDGEMNVRFQAGAVEEHIIEADRFRQAECDGRCPGVAFVRPGRGEQGGELFVDDPQAFLADPLGESIA